MSDPETPTDEMTAARRIMPDPEIRAPSRNPWIRALPWLLAVVGVPAALGQGADELGRPFLRNYLPSEYDAHVWNASAVQDGRGVLYVGNNDGLLEFDGVRWRLIMLPGRSHVQSLGRDGHGRVWVGGLDNLGFVAADSLGRSVFASVTENLPPDRPGPGMARRTLPTPDGIYWQTEASLLRYRPQGGDSLSGTFDSWPLDAGRSAVFEVDGGILLWQEGRGLERLTDGRVVSVPGGSFFADRAVAFVGRRSAASLLVGTVSEGLYLLDDRGGVAAFPARTSRALEGQTVLSGTVLTDGRTAVGTRSSGLLVLDADGNLMYRVDDAAGLQDPSVRFVYADDGGSLWLMLDRGISRVDVDAPFSVFDATRGLADVALAVWRHDGRLYAGTNSGLQVLDPSDRRFHDVEGLGGTPVRGLLTVGEQLFAASGAGVHVVRGERAEPVRSSRSGDFRAFMLVQPEGEDDLLLVGLHDGAAVLRRWGGSWVDAGRLDGVHGLVRHGVALSDGTVWLGTENDGAFRVRITDGPSARPEVERFGPERGLPEGGASVYQVDDAPYFTSFGGRVFGLDRSGSRIVPVTTFDDLRTGYPLDWFGFHQDTRGRVWVPLGNRGMSMAMPLGGGEFAAQPGPLRRLGSSLVILVYPEEDGVVWMAGADGIIRYDPSQATVRASVRGPLIRQVTAGDSLVFGGLGPVPAIELPPSRRTIRFDYALPGFTGSSEYRTWLDGFETGWTPWGTEVSRTFTNLSPGSYALRVEARDIDGRLHPTTRLSFSVRPPWWRTVWAYGLFAGALVGLLWVLRRYEMGRLLLKHRLHLEYLETERLRDLDRVRTDFFANISHEFRTPLTLILGPVSDALEQGRALTREQLQLVRRNGERVLRLINQILDLSKLEGGGMRLRPSTGDIVPFLRGMLHSFESMADRRGIGLSLSTTDPRLPVPFERERLEQVFLNLLSNAVKFTPDGGLITIRCSRSGDGFVEIAVRDTGCGIPADRLPYIFDRFYQSGASPKEEREGTGIGLALTRALVELHGGTIDVASEVGEGTTFTVRLPAEDPPEGDDPVEAEDAGVDAQYHVLVVEDHPDVRQYVRDCLSDEYRIEEAADGLDGLERARAGVPDLIVADVSMPHMDGYDLSRSLRADERTSHVPIILLTARAAEQDKLTGLETGVDDYLLKPFNPAELRLRVRNLIAGREQARRRFSRATVIRPSEVVATSIDQAFLGRVIDCVEAHIPDEQFGVAQLAEEVGMSVSQLNRKLNALIDQTAGSLLRSMRLQRAADLLRQRAGTVSEIAYETGFGSPAHFSTAFRKQFGMPPSEYARED